MEAKGSASRLFEAAEERPPFTHVLLKEMLTPGEHSSSLSFIASVLLVLLAFLSYLTTQGYGSLHVYIVGGLAMALLLSLAWFSSLHTPHKP